MADAFLRELFRTQNRVQSSEEQTCIICMEECGTIRPESGLAEFAVRLKCKHVVGSGCIAEWLRSNNTCPLCRHVFFPAGSPLGREPEASTQFPAQNRSYHENGTRDRRTTHTQPDRARTIHHHTEDFREIQIACRHYCRQLSLHPDIATLAATLAGNLVNPMLSRDVRRHHSDDCIMALGIYIASLLTRDHRSPREILSVMDDVDRGDIRAAWEHISDWDAILDHDVRTQLAGALNIHRPVRPPRRSEFEALESELEDLTLRCTVICDGLGARDYVPAMARRIASRAWNIRTLRQARREPRSLAAACVYMAGHLMLHSRPFPLDYVARKSRVRFAEIEEVYRLLHAERRLIVQECWLRVIGEDSMSRVLAMLPAL